MKLLYCKLMSLGILLGGGSLIHGYAMVHHSTSALPTVDIYMYEADSFADAKTKHQNYERALGIPDTVINVLDKVRGFSAPIATALAAPTEGVTLVLQEGFDMGVSAGLVINKIFGKQIKQAVGAIYGKATDAFNADVPRGNAGRFAEWKNNKQMYAIVVLHDSLIPLHDLPQRVPAGGIQGFAVTAKNDPAKPGNQIYQVIFAPSFAREYIPAEKDTRDRNKIRELAQKSGIAALAGR